jgi:deoxyribose-phosphate aldolase
MDGREFASKLESRIPTSCLDYSAVRCACYEAVKYGFAALTAFPNMLGMCSEILQGSGVRLCALVSYPHGGLTIEQKAEEAADAVENGADEVQFVINTREVLSGNYGYICEEMKAVKRAVPENITVKAVLECEYYQDNEIEGACVSAVEAGIGFVVTSTGEYVSVDKNKNDVPIVTSLHDVEIIKKAVDGKVRIQAEGHIDSLETALPFLGTGVHRVSSGCPEKLLKDFSGQGDDTNV